jgi:electron transfer flavoprotein alpha subunit
MAKILVYTELHGSHVKGVTLEILGRLAGHTVEVAAIGKIPSEATADLAKFGASKVHSLNGAGLDKY